LVPPGEWVEDSGSQCRQILGSQERFEEPDVNEIPDAVIAGGKGLGTGVKFLRDLVWNIEASHQAGWVDLEGRERDPFGLDEVVVSAGEFVDRQFQAGGAEFAAFVAEPQTDSPRSVAEPGNVDLDRRALACDGEPVARPVGRR